MSQWRARRGNTATPSTNTNNSCWNKTRPCQGDAFWYITRSYERSCWELEQNNIEFLFWPPHPRIFRIKHWYLLHSLIFPHSMRLYWCLIWQHLHLAGKYSFLSEVSVCWSCAEKIIKIEGAFSVILPATHHSFQQLLQLLTVTAASKSCCNL